MDFLFIWLTRNRVITLEKLPVIFKDISQMLLLRGVRIPGIRRSSVFEDPKNLQGPECELLDE